AMTLREVLLRAGFVVEPFGAHQLRVAEVPAVFGRNASPDALRVILDELIRGGGRPMESLWQHALATVACHTAVRKGQELTREKMDYILRGLDACEAPHHCPHGRVVSMRVDLGDLDRSFGRS
ncbi:MAG: DNA mismatch repair protein MutL, partial [Acidobacteria bacterium]|nr:DNA mismatch repair protein MutL [Acidobacteriota bacterium]